MFLLLRKKTLTSHWKTFIQPCMWRCKWAELRTRMLLCEASKYDMQAEALSRGKQLTSKNSTVEDTGSKSLPFSGSMQRNTVIERRKRKRVEDTTDIAAYMEQHPLFSYHSRAFYLIRVSFILHLPTHMKKKIIFYS